METWQRASDQRLWKLIVSPEFGEKIDLTRPTRDLMERMANDLETKLEWVAIEHYNSEHPHVHIVLRGLRDNGKALCMSRQYVQEGIRNIAENLCTRSTWVSGTVRCDVLYITGKEADSRAQRTL